MSQQQKSAYWKALKELGVEFPLHYREYSTEQLAGMHAELTGGATPPTPAPAAPKAAPDPVPASVRAVEQDPQYQEFLAWQAQQKAAASTPAPAPVNRNIPRSNMPKANELPGERLNTHDEDQPLRVDDAGRVWYQEEVQKPGYARPRGRRVLKYLDSGVETKQVKNGDYVESFEVGGRQEIPSEVKITLPSYQVGIYKDPRFPFKVVTYNGLAGFDLFEVQNFYGGAELVPADIKRQYVSNVLCYDIRTVIRAIETEFRRNQLTSQNGI